MARHRGRRLARSDNDGVHDAGTGPGLPCLQCTFSATVGVHRSTLHERLAVGRRGDVSDAPGRSGLRAAVAENTPYSPASAGRLGRDRGVFVIARGCGGAGQGNPTILVLIRKDKSSMTASHSKNLLRKMDAYWRASNHLFVCIMTVKHSVYTNLSQ